MLTQPNCINSPSGDAFGPLTALTSLVCVDLYRINVIGNRGLGRQAR